MNTRTEHMRTPGGNRAIDQVVIHTSNCRIFRSYNSNIAKIDINGNVTLDEYFWDYSVTTGKYRNQFLRETKKETEKKIKTGEYKLANLN